MMDGGDWVWGTLMMIVFWGGLAAVVVIGVRAFGGKPGRSAPETTAPDAGAILDARFARGEISEQEYEKAKNVLGLTDHRIPRKVAGAL